MTDLTPRKVITFPKTPKPRLVDCQGERPYRARLADQLKAVKDGLDNGFNATDIRRFERAKSIGFIRDEAKNVLAVIETPKFAAEALRELADEIERGDVA